MFVDTGSTAAATGQAGEPNHAGVSNPLNSHWWDWTPEKTALEFLFWAGQVTTATRRGLIIGVPASVPSSH